MLGVVHGERLFWQPVMGVPHNHRPGFGVMPADKVCRLLIAVTVSEQGAAASGFGLVIVQHVERFLRQAML